jgi:hypothetical protein
MKLSLFVLTAGLAMASLSAQTNNGIRLESTTSGASGGYWLVINAATHPTTTYNFNWRDANPPAYDRLSGIGIATGTRIVRWIPNMFNNMREEQEITAVGVSIRPSAATPATSFPFTGYGYEVQLHQPLQLVAGANYAQGQQIGADFTKPPIATMAQASATLPQMGNYTFTRAFATPVKVTQPDIVMSAKYDANGQTTPINDNNPSHQGFWNTYGDVSLPPAVPHTYGFADAANAMTYPVPATTRLWGHCWLGYNRNEPCLTADATWAHRGGALTTHFGTGIASCVSDVGTNASQLGWVVNGGTARAGDICVFLFNVGPVSPVGLPIGGETFEVNIADPFLLWLGGSLGNPTLDSTGKHSTPLLSVPALGAGAVGAIFGVEVLLVLPNLSGFDGTTQSSWFRINS